MLRLTLVIHKSLMTVCKQRSALIAWCIINPLNLKHPLLGCSNTTSPNCSTTSRQKITQTRLTATLEEHVAANSNPAVYSPVLWH